MLLQIFCWCCLLGWHYHTAELIFRCLRIFRERENKMIGKNLKKTSNKNSNSFLNHLGKISFIKCIYATFIDFFAFTTHISIGRNHLIKNGSTDFVLLVVSCDHISKRQFKNQKPSFRAYTRYPTLNIVASRKRSACRKVKIF